MNTIVSRRDGNGRMASRMPPPRKARRGAVLIAVLVCIGVASMLILTVVTRMMMTHTQLRRQTNVEQAYWLCEAGIQRAQQKLDEDVDYQGETWQVASSELNERGAAEVIIRIQGDEESGAAEKIQVIAKYPVNEPFEMRQTRTVPSGT